MNLLIKDLVDSDYTKSNKFIEDVLKLDPKRQGQILIELIDIEFKFVVEFDEAEEANEKLFIVLRDKRFSDLRENMLGHK
jgi:hypothetical protein